MIRGRLGTERRGGGEIFSLPDTAKTPEELRSFSGTSIHYTRFNLAVKVSYSPEDFTINILTYQFIP